MKVAHICTRNVISVGIVGVLSLDEVVYAPAVTPSALAEAIRTEREAGRFGPGAPPPML